MQNIILIAVLSWSLKSVVLKPLNQIRSALEEIASGDADLTRRLQVIRPDEIGEVARLFNLFVEHLQDVVRQVVQHAGLCNQLLRASQETHDRYHYRHHQGWR